VLGPDVRWDLVLPCRSAAAVSPTGAYASRFLSCPSSKQDQDFFANNIAVRHRITPLAVEYMCELAAKAVSASAAQPCFYLGPAGPPLTAGFGHAFQIGSSGHGVTDSQQILTTRLALGNVPTVGPLTLPDNRQIMFRWVHRFSFAGLSSKAVSIDLVLAGDFSSVTRNPVGPFPLVLIEATRGDDDDKFKQLGCYAVDCSFLFRPDMLVHLLGISLGTETYSAWMYSKEGTSVNAVNLCLNASLSKAQAQLPVLSNLESWCHAVARSLADVLEDNPAVVPRLSPAEPRVALNHHACRLGSRVFKVYDYRHRSSPVGVESRRCPYFYRDLPGFRDEHCECNFQLISYEYQDGEHVPRNVGNVISVLQAVHKLHQRGIVHGDLRWSNVVIPTVGGAAGIIDFDFSSYVPTASIGDKSAAVAKDVRFRRFPDGLLVVPDGKRHPDATSLFKPVMLYHHDAYACAGLLDCLQLCDPETKDGDRPLYAQAISVLQDASNGIGVQSSRPPEADVVEMSFLRTKSALESAISLLTQIGSSLSIEWRSDGLPPA